MKAKLGMGGYFVNPVDHPERIIRYAYDMLDIRIFDTSPAYGASEEFFGHALRDYQRESYLLSTKTKAATVKELHLSLVNSLGKLNTDYVDFYFGHSFIDDDETLEKSMNVLHEMKNIKDKGFIKSVGVSGHSVTAAMTAIESGFVDIIMVPFSLMHREFESIIQCAKEKGISVVTMKNFASGILLGGPSDNEFKRTVTLQKVMNFSAYNGDLIIPAYRSIEQLQQIANAYCFAEKLSEKEIMILENQIVDFFGSDFCRFCNECRPCQKYGWAMSQPGILKCAIYQEKFGLDMKDSYEKYKYNVNDCKDCDSQCSSNCPFGINIKEKMQQAHDLFSGVDKDETISK